MNKQQAQNIVRETFENSFDKTVFALLIKNLLNQIDEAPFTYQGNYIPDAYKQYVKKLERIGKYSDSENSIDILVVTLKKETSLEHARTVQRNFIAWYLNGSRGGNRKDAALVAFVSPNKADWRFSLVKMDYKFEHTKSGKIKVKEEFTPARRWSFLVGENEKSHTAQSRLIRILENDEQAPTLQEIEEAFNIETVTKEFFVNYRELFLRTKLEMDKVLKNNPKVRADFEAKGVDTVNFAKKLLGQIVFLYFLQKKGWFGVGRDDDWGDGSKHFLRELFEGKYEEYDNFFNNILEPLFYEALRDDHSFDDHYYSRFNCKIPFLNGGLFDPIGNYNWIQADIALPDSLFSNNVKTKEGDVGNGILDIFDRYNFTVKEDEPLEKEVAIDPELLGKTYEKFNAIRPDNFEEYKSVLKSGKKGEEGKFNKQFGVYYTPREIVHYMCQQSLINYLSTELDGKVSKEDIETLIHLGEHINENEATVLIKEIKIERGKQKTTENKSALSKNIRNNALRIDQKLAEIRVCDPAVGSGAFPVGMMNEIIRTRNLLSTFMPTKKSRKYYDFKRQCIEHALYGVDIDPGAVEITKLRLWLSLVVDEEDVKQIKPLPNLDYKIVCGNSLMSVEKNILNYELFNKLEDLKPLFFNETNIKKKQEYKNQIDELINQITNRRKDFDFEIYFSEVFHEKNGFDIVIANPPYVEHKKLKNISNLLKKFNIYSGTADLYIYFYEVALNILREKGTLIFISSNKFIRTRYGSPLRKLLAKNRIHTIIDFTKVKIFDSLVASCIILVSKRKPTDNVIVTFADDTLSNNLANYIEENHIKVTTDSLDSDIWQLEDKNKLKIKQLIEINSKKLREIEGVNVYRGVTTGYNTAFIIDDDKQKKLIEQDKSNKEVIKPLLQGRNIKKWVYKESNEYLLFIPWHFPFHSDGTISGASAKAEKAFKDNYTILYEYLKRFKTELLNRNKQETGIRYEWYALQRCAASYYSEFEKEKIIWALTSDKWTFAYDNKGHYLPSNGYILTSSILSIKYLLALMNSILMQFYFGFIGIMTAGGAYTLKHETIAEFPIKKLSRVEQMPFIEIVDKIIAITKHDDYLENPAKQAKVHEYEKEIDQLVYELYGLTPEEIKVIEGYE